MRPRLVLALALCLSLTAGCTTLGGGGETPTLTPADVPSPSESASAGDRGVGPVVSPAGIAGPTHLASRHVAVVENASFRWSEREREFDGTGPDRRVTAATTLSAVRNGSRFLHTFEFDGPAASRAGPYILGLVAFGNGSDVYLRRQTSRSEQVHYERGANATFSLEPHRSAARAIRTYLDLETATIVRIQSASEERYLVTGSFDDHVSYGPVEDGRVRAIVRADGFVSRLSAKFTVTGAGRRIPVEYAFRYHSLGNATVTRPDWVRTARQRLGATGRDP